MVDSRNPLRLRFSFFVIALAAWSTAAHAAAPDDQRPIFESSVRPLLSKKCGKCHNSKAPKGGLDLSTMEGLRRGGESGESVVADSLEESLLWNMVDGGEMPPEGEPRLTAAEKKQIRLWIEAGAHSSRSSQDAVTQHDVLPYLYTRCVVCHGAQKKEAGLDLRSVESILRGGKSGPAVVAGKPNESLLLKRVLSKDMPPPKELIRAGVRPMEAAEIELLRRWIAQGAKQYDIRPDVQTDQPDPLVSDRQRRFWAFQTPRKPPAPTPHSFANDNAQVRTPVDAFLLRKLQEKNLSLAPEAPRLTLIRRVAFDLTGLPPKWEQVQRFAGDPSPDWYSKLVDFYLDSPRYGERWGRFWLDLCGYADSEGKRSADPIRPHAWRYRDYVIRSFNQDKAYHQFLLEQLAGDELYDFEAADEVTPAMMDALAATGFLRMAPDGTGSDIVDTVEERFEVVADEIEVLGSAVLGLTLKCAQCHSHKYDPIPQRDYYRLVAVFAGAYDVYDWLKPTSVPGQSKQQAPTRRYLKHVTAEIRAKWEKSHDEMIQKINAEKKRKSGKANKRLKQLQAQLPPEPMIRALWDRGRPSPTWIFRRGQFTNPGDLVGPGVLSVLSDGRTPFVPQPRWPGSTGRRLALANWLIDPRHPLTARVLVNRVWFHHFGRGIVESLANFGKTGTPPTHPELLDWLAVSFMENGWSLKWLHRQIMNSAAYRQSSKWRPESEQRDPLNRWLSRMPLRRREAESVRDSLLAVSGQLSAGRFGPPDPVTVRADGLVTSQKNGGGWRRTVYVLQRRKELPTILETFDLPQMQPNCVARPNSTVATQALHLLNNAMIRELSLEFAKRIASESSGDPARQVDLVFQTALSRSPTLIEKEHLLETLERLRAHWRNPNLALSAPATQDTNQQPTPDVKALANICHVVMNSAEFLFID